MIQVKTQLKIKKAYTRVEYDTDHYSLVRQSIQRGDWDPLNPRDHRSIFSCIRGRTEAPSRATRARRQLLLSTPTLFEVFLKKQVYISLVCCLVVSDAP